MGDTAYAKCGDLSLAYQVFGDGPVNLVIAGSFVSNVELMWTSPEAKSFFDHLSPFCRVLLFDKAGVGLSDPVPRVRAIEERGAEIEAVMDAAGFERAALMGISEGGPAAVVFAASRPDRVQSLVLVGTFAVNPMVGWDDLDIAPALIRERALAILPEEFTPTAAQFGALQAFGRAVKERWGTGEAMGLLLPSMPSRMQLGMLERMSASPGMAVATVEASMHIDVRPAAATVGVPTLVIHARDDLVPVQCGRYLAELIPGARLFEIDGKDHAPWLSQPALVLGEVEEMLTGARHVHAATRALRTVLFTDVVASTERAAALGDEHWHAVLERFGELTAEAVDRFGGRIVKSTGDGHLATFDGPAQAIRGAEAIRSGAEAIPLEIRAGVHTGECELLGNDIAGMAVHIASRVTGCAEAGEILVSSTVRDLVVGSGIGFEDRGARELKGVPGSWQLLSIRREGAAPGSDEARIAALPTPPMRTGMRRSDRAVAALARRVPKVMRGLTRVTPKAR